MKSAMPTEYGILAGVADCISVTRGICCFDLAAQLSTSWSTLYVISIEQVRLGAVIRRG